VRLPGDRIADALGEKVIRSTDHMIRLSSIKTTGRSDALLAIRRDARPCQRGVLFAGDGVGAAE
jgi:hypothetical protein